MGHDGRQLDAVAHNRQAHGLALASLHVGEQGLNGMEGMTIDGLDGVAVAEAGLGGGRTGLHLLDADGAMDILREWRRHR